MGLFGKRRDTSKWLTAIARIDEIGVGGNTVNFSGAFTVEGDFYSVMVDRDFKSVSEAEAWAARIEASPTLTVRYNPDDPSENVVEDAPTG
jgi:hypothetical protein